MNHGGQVVALFAQFVVKRAPSVEGLLKFRQTFVQTRFGESRGQIADQSGTAAAFGNGAFRGIVGSVEIQVGQIVNQAIGPAIARQARLLARHEFQGAVRAKVQDGIGFEILAQVAIESAESMRGCKACFKQQAHGVAFVAKAGLNAN